MLRAAILLLIFNMFTQMTMCSPTQNQRQPAFEDELEERNEVVDEKTPDINLTIREILREYASEIMEEREVHETDFA